MNISTKKVFNTKLFDFDQIKFSMNFDPNQIIPGFLYIYFLATWRAQLAEACRNLGLKDSTIQMLETAKFQSKSFELYAILRVFAVLSIKASMILDAEALRNSDNRKAYIESQIERIISPGPSKILSPSQIRNADDIIITRKGIVAKEKGEINAIALYKTSQLITEVNLTKINFSDFVTGFYSFLMEAGISYETIHNALINYDVEISNDELKSPYPSDIDPIVLAKNILQQTFHDMDFNDAIRLPFENNLLPIESDSITVNRSKPATLSMVDVAIDDPDPLMRELFKQQEEYKTEMLKLEKSKIESKSKRNKFKKK